MKKRTAPAPLKTIDIVPYGMKLHLFSDRRRFVRSVNACRGNDSLKFAEVREAFGWCELDVKRHPSDIWIYSGAHPELIAHELYHAVEYVRQHVGLESGFDASEPAAYLFAYLFTECWNVLSEAAA